MTARRIGVVSPTEVAFPTVRAAFAGLWPEAEIACQLDQSLYLDFINDDMTVPDPMPEAAYDRIAAVLRYARDCRVDGIIFCGSVFGRLVEAGREALDVPVLTSYEGMIEAAFANGPRMGILATTQGTVDCLSGDIERYAGERGLDYSISGKVAEGAFETLIGGDRLGHDDIVVAAAETITDFDSLLLGQFSMGLVPQKITPVAGRPVLTAPHTAVAKMRELLAA
ncbi:MAG: aspartate/glutamate racemase family protein [Alphaproteobacteria bacterium]